MTIIERLQLNLKTDTEALVNDIYTKCMDPQYRIWMPLKCYNTQIVKESTFERDIEFMRQTYSKLMFSETCKEFMSKIIYSFSKLEFKGLQALNETTSMAAESEDRKMLDLVSFNISLVTSKRFMIKIFVCTIEMEK